MWLLYTLLWYFIFLILIVVYGHDLDCGVVTMIFTPRRGYGGRPACFTNSFFLPCLSEQQSLTESSPTGSEYLEPTSELSQLDLYSPKLLHL